MAHALVAGRLTDDPIFEKHHSFVYVKRSIRHFFARLPIRSRFLLMMTLWQETSDSLFMNDEREQEAKRKKKNDSSRRHARIQTHGVHRFAGPVPRALQRRTRRVSPMPERGLDRGA